MWKNKTKGVDKALNISTAAKYRFSIHAKYPGTSSAKGAVARLLIVDISFGDPARI